MRTHTYTRTSRRCLSTTMRTHTYTRTCRRCLSTTMRTRTRTRTCRRCTQNEFTQLFSGCVEIIIVSPLQQVKARI
ncbi:hypothetical protein LEMLEM_LOCUS9923 [Lemmus lemmus]